MGMNPKSTVMTLLVIVFALIGNAAASAGVITTNGWYEGDEIYYIDLGVEEGITERGENQIYLIGDARLHQANVVLHIPGEPDYTPHWNVNVVHTAEGVVVQDIIDAGLSSPLFLAGNEEGEHIGTLFDDVEDILEAEELDLVTIEQPGVVVLCPVISEPGAEAPGNDELPEDEFVVLDPGDTF